MPFAEFLRNRPAGLAIAAGLLLGACAPAAHVDGVSGGDSATMLRIGDSARDAGDITAAIPIYRRAHALAPLENAPLLRLANTLHAVGAYHEAGDAWSRVLRLDHRSFEARVGYGETLVALGQPTLALEQFRLAREIGQDATLFNGIGVANDMLGDAAAAQAAYREGLTIERSLRLLNNLGLSLALSGAHNEAVAILEEANAFPGAGLRHKSNLVLAYRLAGLEIQADRLAETMMDTLSAERSRVFHTTVAALPDHKARVAAIGAYSAEREGGAISLVNSRSGR
jgi:Flp pilus assembly protein TadD